MSNLTSNDCRFILSSLDLLKQKFEAYPYDNEAMRKLRLQETRAVVLKVRELRDELKAEEKGKRGNR